MSGNLFIGPQEQTALRLAVEAARKNPVPIAEIMQYKIPQAAFMVELSDRKGTPPGRHSQHVLLPIGYRVSISFEEQPAASACICRCPPALPAWCRTLRRCG